MSLKCRFCGSTELIAQGESIRCNDCGKLQGPVGFAPLT